MKVESIAECWSIIQYFWPAFSDNRSWEPIFGLFEWPLKTGFTVLYCFTWSDAQFFDFKHIASNSLHTEKYEKPN